MTVVAGGLLGFVGQAAVPDVVEAKAFHVVTDDGTVLVKLEDTYGRGFGKAGTIRTINGDEQELVMLGAGPEGGGMVRTMNSEGHPVVVLTAHPEGHGMVMTSNDKGKDLVRLEANTHGGVVTVLNNNGIPVVMLASIEGHGLMAAFDPSSREETGVLTTRPK